jgi:hypothetical protein
MAETDAPRSSGAMTLGQRPLVQSAVRRQTPRDEGQRLSLGTLLNDDLRSSDEAGVRPILKLLAIGGVDLRLADRLPELCLVVHHF